MRASPSRRPNDPQRREPVARRPRAAMLEPLLQPVPVEQVVRVERDDPAVGVDDVDAGLLHAPHVEVMRVEELHDDHAEDVVVGDVRRARRPAAGSRAVAAATCADEPGLAPVEKSLNSWSRSGWFCSYMIVLPSPCSSTCGSTMPVSGVTHRRRASARRPSRGSRGGRGRGPRRVGLNTRRLREDLLADLAERQAVGGGVEVFRSAGGLDRLERDAADAALLQREVDDLADLVVVQALLQRDDERRGDVVLVEPLERPPADVGQVFAAKRAQRRRAAASRTGGTPRSRGM